MNSFGYGGSNAHVVLEDAFHFLRSRNLVGNHASVEFSRLPIQLCPDEKGSQNQEELASTPFETNARDLRLFVFSSADKGGISRLARTYYDFVFENRVSGKVAHKFLRQLSYTLGEKRTTLPWRSYVVADSIETLGSSLLDGLAKPFRCPISRPRLTFVFTGQGSQWVGMGQELLAFPVFESSVRQATEHFQRLGASWSLIGE